VDAPEATAFFASSKLTASMSAPQTLPATLGRAQLDGGGGANLLSMLGSTTDNPAGIAIDLVGERIYWSGASTSGSPAIYTAKLDGRDRKTFLTRSTAPQGLAIDATGRRIYWAQTGIGTRGGIYYADLDAVTPTATQVSTGTLVSNNPKGIALDLAGDRIFWT